MAYGRNVSSCDPSRENIISLGEAIAYAVDSINKHQDLLPNIDLGFEIRTDCSNEDITLWTSMTLAGVIVLGL